MTAEDRLQQLSHILEPAKHSTPSVSKYRGLEKFLAELTGLDAESVYPTFASKAGNISVRSGQSKRAMNAALMVFVVKRTDQHDAMQRAAREFATQQRKPVLLIQRDDIAPSWAPSYGIVPAGDRAALSLINSLRESLGPFEVVRIPRPRTGSDDQYERARHNYPPFSALASRQFPARLGPEELILVPDSWDDYGFLTLFDLYYRDETQSLHEIGQVKIGSQGLEHGRPPVPDAFDSLASGFFSLGQDDTYYEKLEDHNLREHVLTALRDMAFDEHTFQSSISSEVATKSLFRTVPQSTTEVQFRRMAHGGARLTNYRFRYAKPADEEISDESLDLSFEVHAQSQPSTNIHVVIGSNGVGKTTLLKGMSAALAPLDTPTGEGQGVFFDLDDEAGSKSAETPFSNVIFVSFSAFDPFLPAMANLSEEDIDTLFSAVQNRVPISYIGLGRIGSSNTTPKDIGELSDDFLNGVESCIRSAARRARWKRALKALEADPIFRDLDILSVVDSVSPVKADEPASEAVELELGDLFNKSSSGHKIVLLTITRLVEALRERSLVLFDEPESHLHPPLLSAFMRALSELLADRNGTAILATHSPVVLQEVPRDCVWKLRRSGSQSTADRPQIETFGENVGVLTHEVFGLEVTQSGYHAELRRVAAEVDSFDEAMARFGGKLGSEAQGIIRILLAIKPSEGTR
ncbi:AAA family ATPase [Streptomyces sp. ISL-1]|uniref:AAA family ATPase n=1 Tax=Streptomyces sp. ISL-1 TaxID=2817657 RepID=UPI001BEB4BFF|nr:ATP-binding protein [Streptomyces sp. ISL-1]MBT2393420.1 AAA family ATPase [Streptomyces sp. ISL-1]